MISLSLKDSGKDFELGRIQKDGPQNGGLDIDIEAGIVDVSTEVQDSGLLDFYPKVCFSLNKL